MTKSIRIGALLLLLLGIAGITGAPVQSALAATSLTVTDCSGEYGAGGTSTSPASGSLASAVNQANTENAGDTITFGCGGTITMSSTLTISGSLKIDGSGQNVVLNGGGAQRLFYVNKGVTAYLTALTLSGGYAYEEGGAIESYGTLTVTNSTFSGNHIDEDDYGNGGGAIMGFGTTTIDSSTFSGNSAPYSAGLTVGGTFANYGTATVTNSTFSGNSAYIGGAIYNSGPLTVTNSTFSKNSALQGGGAILTSVYGTAKVTDSTLSGNSASYGGAIYSGGPMTVTNSTLSGNSAGYGGAIYDEEAAAGTPYALDGALTITNSTLSGNSASYWGGVIDNNYATVTINNSTLSGNSVGTSTYPGTGGAIYNEGTTIIGGSILSGNKGGNCYAALSTVILTDSGYNLESGTDCGFKDVSNGGTSLTSSDPLFVTAGMQNNGGPTQTIAIQSDSPAIDQIPATNSLCPSTDQRGVPRPQGAKCDIGAYEYDAGANTTFPTVTVTAPSVPALQDGYFNATDLTDNGGVINVNVSATDASGVTNLECTDPLMGGSLTVVNQTGSSTRTGSVSISGDGIHHVSCTATNGAGSTGAASGSTNTATVKIDTTAPTSSSQCDTSSCSGTSGVTVTLNATDGVNGSGVGEIVYTTDGSDPSATNGTVYSGPFSVSPPPNVPSTTTVKYVAIDSAGNVGSIQSQTVSFLANTILTVSPTLATYGGLVDISATLSPAVSGEPITFYFNGTPLCGPWSGDGSDCPTTDVAGVATLAGFDLSSINSTYPNAGTYPSAGSCDAKNGVYASFDGDTSYAPSNSCNTLTITQKDLHVTVSHSPISYGADIPGSYDVSFDTSDFASGDDPSVISGSPSCDTTYTTTSPVGSYAINCTIGGLSAQNYTFVSGYTGTGTDGTSDQPLTNGPLLLGMLEVDQAHPSFNFVLPSGFSSTYGDGKVDVSGYVSKPSADTGAVSYETGTGSAGCSVDSSTGVVSINDATGSKQCVIDASITGDANYAAAGPDEQSFTISPALLSVTVTHDAVTYGDAAPTSFTVAYSGFVNGDLQSVVGGAPTCTTAYTSASSVSGSPYSISCTLGSLSSANYTFVSGFTGTAGAPLLSSTATQLGTFTVNKASLSVVAPSPTMTYGDATLPSLAPTVTGMNSSDSFTGLGGTCSLLTVGTTPSAVTLSSSTPAGTYTVHCRGVDTTNYSVSYTDGLLTVNQAKLTITASSGSMTYGGTVPTITPQYSAFAGNDNAASLTTAPTCSTAATSSSGVGQYTSTCSGAVDNNYTISYLPGSVRVNPVVLTVTAPNASVQYSDALPVLPPAITGYALGQDASALTTAPTCSTTATTGSFTNAAGTTTTTSGVNSPAGTYAITCSGGAATNYTFDYTSSAHYTPGTLTVAQEDATVQLSADSSAQVLGTGPITLTATVRDSAASGYTGANGESGTSATVGDVTKTFVEFDIYNAATCLSGTPAMSPVVSVTSSTRGIGTATYSLPSPATDASYCVVPRVVAGPATAGNGYGINGPNPYYTAPPGSVTGVAFYQNTGQFATGGGSIADSGSSTGQGALSFNARYTKQGGAKGQMMYSWQGTYQGQAATYTITSNAISTLSFSGSTTAVPAITTTLQGKCAESIVSVATGQVLSSQGNLTFTATAKDGDYGQSQNIPSDAFSLSVFDNSNQSIEQVATTPLGGGNLVVHNG